MGNFFSFSCCGERHSDRVVAIEVKPAECAASSDNKMASSTRPPRITERYKKVHISTRNQMLRNEIKLASLTFEREYGNGDCDGGLVDIVRPKNPSPPEQIQIIDSCESMKTHTGSSCSQDSAEVVVKKAEDCKVTEHEIVDVSVEEIKNAENGNGNPEPSRVTLGSVNASSEPRRILAKRSYTEPRRGPSSVPTLPRVNATPVALVQANYAPVVQQQQQSTGNQQPKRYHYRRTSSTAVKSGADGATFTSQQQTGLLPQVLNHQHLFGHVKPFKDYGEDLYKRVSYSRHLVNEVLMPPSSSNSGIKYIDERRLEPEGAGQGISIEGKSITSALGGDTVQRDASVRIDASSDLTEVQVGSNSADYSGYLWKNAFDASRTKIHRMSGSIDDSNVASSTIQDNDSESQSEDENEVDSNDGGQHNSPDIQMVGNVRRVNVLPAGCDRPRMCRHGRYSCTLCSRPTGRVGREFKSRQDEYNNMLRESRRRKERKRVSDAGEFSFDDAESHLEQSRLHLQSLEDDLFIAWSQSDDAKEQAYARCYDLSRSNPADIRRQARQLFIDLRLPEEVKQFLEMAERNGKEKFDIRDTFQEALAVIIEKVKHSRQGEDLDTFDEIICMVKEHVDSNGSLLSQDDVLEIVRPFCADLAVETRLKMDILQLIENSFELSGDDIFLLVFYHTDAILSSSWGKKINPEEIDSDDKRHSLFQTLINESSDVEQLRSIGQLLLTWPVLAAIELNEKNPDDNPWIILYKKLILHQDFEHLLEFIKQASNKVSFSFECYNNIYSALFEGGFYLVALKMVLISENENCIDQAYNDMECVEFGENCNDEELFKLVIQSKTVYRIPSTALYPSFVHYIISQSNNEALFADVVTQLRTSGLHAEADEEEASGWFGKKVLESEDNLGQMIGKTWLGKLWLFPTESIQIGFLQMVSKPLSIAL
eukprot:gene9895-10908_t